jgi:hypothetical protein
MTETQQKQNEMGQLKQGGKDACKTYVVLHSPESHSLLASAVVEPTEFGGPRGGLLLSVELSHAALSLDHGRGVQQFGEHGCSKLFSKGDQLAKNCSCKRATNVQGSKVGEPDQHAMWHMVIPSAGQQEYLQQRESWACSLLELARGGGEGGGQLGKRGRRVQRVESVLCHEWPFAASVPPLPMKKHHQYEKFLKAQNQLC